MRYYYLIENRDGQRKWVAFRRSQVEVEEVQVQPQVDVHVRLQD